MPHTQRVSMRLAALVTVAAALLGVAAVALAAEHKAISVPLAMVDVGDKAAQVVADPAAESRKALAVNLGAGRGNYSLFATGQQLPAGRYHATYHLRLRHAKGDDISRLVLELTTTLGNTLHTQELVWTQFDSRPYRYTSIEVELIIPAACEPKFSLAWRQSFAGPVARMRPMHEVEPTTDPFDAAFSQPKAVTGDDELLSEIKNNNQGAPLASINGPVVLLDRVVFQPLSQSQWIETVRPQYVHVYPGGANPVIAELRNSEQRSVQAVAQLEICAGLDEVLHTASQTITLPPHSTTSCRFDWNAGQREFGHESRLTLLVDGKVVDRRSEYFSVSDPIWKTALQGSGFLNWKGREKEIPSHVAYNRTTYQNVEEAFSWQPSSWTDLNPTTNEWWTGQGNAHNSLAGLKQWIGMSHEHGIKMITYLWPTASGPSGMEWVRQNPELVQFSGGNFDVEDLRLKPLIEANPRWWRLQGGVWNHIYVNRGLLRTIEKGVAETIASAKKFGWDGARFDKPPGWNHMPAETMHAEFKSLHVADLMQRLVPEYYRQTTGNWDAEAVSVTNVRYAKHRFHEHDPHFALSYNGAVGARPEGKSASLDEMMAGGGQGMNESMRLMSAAPWRDYLMKARSEADLAHERGGFHCTVKPDAFGTALHCFSGLCVLIAGSHPYGDFGWGGPLPGHYSQFVTRYGEFCWSQDLRPTTAEAAAFAAAGDEQLWWRELVKHRRTADGREQWVVHLLSNPPTETMTAKQPGTMTPWREGLTIGRQTSHAPEVWALTAEPTTRATRLNARQDGDRFVVELPEHRVWTMLVWTEADR